MKKMGVVLKLQKESSKTCTMKMTLIWWLLMKIKEQSEKKGINNKGDQIKTTGTSISLKADYEDTEVVDSFCLFRINNQR